MLLIYVKLVYSKTNNLLDIVDLTFLGCDIVIN